VYALVYLGLAWVETVWMFWLLVFLYGVYYGLTEGVEKAMVAAFSPSAYRGTAFGIYHGAVGLAALPASLVFGVFWAVLGPRLAFSIGAGLAAVAAVGLVVLLAAVRRPKDMKDIITGGTGGS
jgi:MFS family permease